MMKGKIHQATVTEMNIDYMGSLALDEKFINVAGLKKYEKIQAQVLVIIKGSYIETYVLQGESETG